MKAQRSATGPRGDTVTAPILVAARKPNPTTLASAAAGPRTSPLRRHRNRRLATEETHPCLHLRAGARASTTLRSSTTPVASGSSPTCTAAGAAEIVRPGPLDALQPSTTAKRPTPRPTSATAPACLVQVPDRFLRAVVDFDLPAAGAYAVGMAFLLPPTPSRPPRRVEKHRGRGGPRPSSAGGAVPTDPSTLGQPGRRRGHAGVPHALPQAGANGESASTSTRLCFVARKRIEHEIDTGAGQRGEAPSTSRRSPRERSSTRACSSSGQVEEFFAADLRDERLESAICLVHSRFSTNTFPVVAAGPPLPVRRPQRRDQHGAGQLRTGSGPGKLLLATSDLPGLERAFPICTPGSSDTCRFDEALELLHLGGRSLPPRRPP